MKAAAATLPSSFVRELAREFRAQDASGAWDGKTDAELLAPFLQGGDPAGVDPEVYWRIELFYGAVGMAIERRTGVACTPMLKMHHEGFGRVVLLAGRLVVVDKFLRDADRFHFESLERLAEAGERLVAGGVEMVEAFPDSARYAS